jgi:hypothetical protein
MTWRKWWILEALFAACIAFAIEPLNWKRYALSIFLIVGLEICYLERVKMQIAEKVK